MGPFKYVELGMLVSNFLLSSDVFFTLLIVLLKLLSNSDSFKLIHCHLLNILKK